MGTSTLHGGGSPVATRPEEGARAVLVAADEVSSHRIRSVLARDGLAVAATTPELAVASRPGELAAAVLACEPGAVEGQVARLRELLPDIRLVVVCPAGDRRTVRTAVAAGADGYVQDALMERALAAAVRGVAAGLACVPLETREMFGRPAFSHREKQVLELVARGYRNAEIATRLYLAESTIKSHLSSSFRKLGVRTRREAAAVVLDPEQWPELRTPDDDPYR